MKQSIKKVNNPQEEKKKSSYPVKKHFNNTSN